MDCGLIRQNAADWMITRCWKSKFGKKSGFIQSLYEHTDVELNALFTLLPILGNANHYDFSPHEEQALIVGTIAHDVGKERPEWQHYVQSSPEEQRKHFIPHIVPELTEEVVPELVHYLDFDESIIPDAIVFVNTHMAAAKTATSVMGILAEIGTSNRWATLARIVDAIDNICSAKGIFQARRALETCIFVRHLKNPIPYHLVRLRGVSTTLLHRAALEAFIGAGWSPLLHFSNGTIYVADSTADVMEPPVKNIEVRLGEAFNEAMDVNFAKFVVGNPLQTFIPKPEFIDYREFERYLKEAAKRTRRGSFLKKSLPARRKVVESYCKTAGKGTNLTEAQIEAQSQRIDRAQPEMLVLKFFKKALSEEILGRDCIQIDQAEIDELEQKSQKALKVGQDPTKVQDQYEKAIDKLKKKAWQKIEKGINVKYDSIFGDGTYEALPSSTLMPAKEMAAAIDPYWQIPGSKFGQSYDTMESAPDGVRMNRLIDTLVDIARESYANLSEEFRPIRASPSDLSAQFINDLIYPAIKTNLKELAEAQLQAYRQSKINAKRIDDSPHLCPICNQPFTKGAIAIANLVGKGADAHTNRAVAHGKCPSPRVIICSTCKYEIFLRQLLLGDQTTGLLVLFPRMNIGPWAGDALKRRAIQVQEYAQQLMSNCTTNPDEIIDLSLTRIIAGNLLNRQANSQDDATIFSALERGLDARQLIELLTYKPDPKTKEKRRELLSKDLREVYELNSEMKDFEQLNNEWNTTYKNWDALIDGVWAGEVHNEPVDEIRAKVYGLRPSFKIICQTPHMILVPLAKPFKAESKESGANAALRELFAVIVLGLTLDCSVAVLDTGEPITFEGGEGVARVPAVPAIRNLVGSEWLDLAKAKKWLRAIGAASLLANDTSYSERSNLYQILSAPGPGHILRRIEQKSAKKKRQVDYWHIQLIETLKEVLHA